MILRCTIQWLHTLSPISLVVIKYAMFPGVYIAAYVCSGRGGGGIIYHINKKKCPSPYPEPTHNTNFTPK